MNRISGLCCRPLIALIVVSVLGGAIYSNTLSTPFIFDDVRNISENTSVQWDSLSWSQLWQTVATPPANVSKSRPVAYVSFALNYYFGGRDSVAGYHLVNMVVHVVNGMLVYLLVFVVLGRLHGGRHVGLETFTADGPADEAISTRAFLGPLVPAPFIPALVAACVFVAHPIQTQAVTYVVQRMTSMAVLFYLAALLFYIYGCLSTTASRRWASWIACVALWGLALGTKQIAITFPAAVVLVEWFFFCHVDRAWWKRALVWGGLGLSLLVVGFWYSSMGISTGNSTGKTFLSFENRDFTMLERVLTQPRVVLLYASLVVLPLPWRLNLLHDVPISQSLFDPPTTALSIVAILALLALAVWFARRAPLLSFGIIWFFLHLVLESSILPLEMVYEHRVYLPMFGVALIVACGVQWLLAYRRMWTAAPIALVIIALGAATYARNNDWRDRVALWSDVIAKSPQLDRGFTNRGVAYQQLGRYDEAIADHTSAINIKSDRAPSYCDRGIAFQLMKSHDRALADYNKAIQLDRNFAAAFNNRGKLYEQMGRRKIALADYATAIELEPHSAVVYLNRGNVYRALGKGQLAIRDYTKAIELGASSYKAYNDRGTVFMLTGKWESAIRDFSDAVAINGKDAGGHNNLAWILATCPEARFRNGNKAVSHALRATELLGNGNVDALDTLAAAYAEAGRFDEAVKIQAEAVGVTPREDLSTRLELYKKGRPYRMDRSDR